MRKHAAAVGIVFLITIALYSRVSGAFFCGFDDFNEVHRAAFEDSPRPGLMFTTSHFNTSKYRPLNRVLTLISYRAGGFSAKYFRLRNLLFHLLAIAALYGISFLLFDSLSAAAAGALLFAVSPLVNQNLTAAIFTNTAAYSLLLVALFLFIYSFRAPGQRIAYLLLALFLSVVALFAYESTIVLFGVIAAYLAFAALEGKRPHSVSAVYTALLAAGSLVAAGIYLFARAMVVTQKSPLVPVAAILRSFAAYTAALLSPIDPVFANYCCSLPLPPVLRLSRGAVLLLMLVATAFVAVVVALMRRPRVRHAFGLVRWHSVAWLLASAFIALLPFVLFTDHVSETYLYLPEAFYSVALTAILSRVLPLRVYAAVVIALAALYVTSSLIRNQRVISCGNIAARILSQLPLKQWETGSHRVALAECAGETELPHYGVYGYDGLSTIDTGLPGLGAAQSALQLATLNRAVKAEVDNGSALCPAGNECFCVMKDGKVLQRNAPSPGR